MVLLKRNKNYVYPPNTDNKAQKAHSLAFVTCYLLPISCFRPKDSVKEDAPVKINVVSDNTNNAKLDAVMRNAELPQALSARIKTAAANSAFMADLSACLEGDRYLRALVDKKHSLPTGYAPNDLVTLTDSSYRVSRNGLTLRRVAAAALDEMAKAARADGVTLVASSTYRSYDYQTQVYNRNVREMGQEAADRESAKPGHSQHQTGLVVDFGSIDDSFAATPAGRWMKANASRYGWSLSFPDGYEEVTGYRWESWHYRYVGKGLAAFIDKYFDGIQQYALRFLYEWEQFRNS
jgi:D-alanyl-D-alanine carboxypeptidase